MNFLEMQKDVQRYISDTSAGTLPLIKDEINSAIDSILNSGFWRFTMRTASVNTTSGVQGYYFPSDFEKVISITDPTGAWQLTRMWAADFDRVVPDPSQGGGSRPKYYMELLEDRVFAQPTTTAKVSIVSDSNSDLTQYTTIYGVVGGADMQETVTLSGQNFVSSVNSYSKLYGITLNLSCAGTLAAYEETVGTSLLKLYPTQTERSFKRYNLYPIPDGTYTLTLTYQAKSLPLVNDSDVPIVPTRYHAAIVDAAIGRLLMKQGDPKATYFLKSADDAMKEMQRNEDMIWDYTSTIRLSDVATPYNPSNPLVG